eukprot:TRINITY_DN36853_c0_g1_i1.p1 TRINITY_DN36853_c0_g1~~TRINITY_DN36853_c0_g1_i1.p1  ORF type:complete len:906 (-),score=113.55 TRINITY_DN36853_c0_g1_i1:240-2957(-)
MAIHVASVLVAVTIATCIVQSADGATKLADETISAGSWDFIVVGAGTGGSLCAARLADSGAEVLLLEAGGWDDPQLYDRPNKYGKGKDGVWHYPTRLSGSLSVNNADGLRHAVLAGKIMGGTSSIHGDVYDRPPFAEFEARGMPAWDETTVRSAFQRIEKDLELNWLGDSPSDLPNMLGWFWQTLASGFGVTDYVQQNSDGSKIGLSTGWLRYLSCSSPVLADCKRRTSYANFVAPRNTSSITVFDNAAVSHVLMHEGQAVGVEVARHGVVHKIFALRAVVLAAGAIGTPQILMRSGVGDPLELQGLGVPVRVPNREVGQGLADHLAHYSWLVLIGDWDNVIKDGSCDEKERFNVFLDSSALGDEGRGEIDAEIRFLVGCNRSRRTIDVGVEAILLNPESRGRVMMQSSDPEALPVVEFPPIWESDFDRLEAIIAKLATVIDTPPESLTSQYGVGLSESIRKTAYLYQHMCCSARAAPAGFPGVCDENLRVRGVGGLYVADASGLPFLPSAHTSSGALLVAELASQHAVAHAAPRSMPALAVFGALSAVPTSASPSEARETKFPRGALPVADRPASQLMPFRSMVPEVMLATGVSGPSRYQLVALPLVGLGTGTLKLDRVEGAVATFLHFGGRHIDTASMYDNYKEIRKGIESSGLENRSEVVFTVKMMPLGFDFVRQAVGAAIKELGTAYLDIGLLHWPGDVTSGKLLHDAPLPTCVESGTRKLASVGASHHGATSWRRCRAESYAALLLEFAEGRVRAVGVSNFAAFHLDEMAAMGYAPPAVHQMEMHPLLHDNRLLHRHSLEGVHVQAYGCLGGKHTGAYLLNDLSVNKIAQRNNLTAAQVLMRWALHRGVSVIGGGSTEQHIKENMELFSFELASSDIEHLSLTPVERMRRSYGPEPEEIL